MIGEYDSGDSVRVIAAPLTVEQRRRLAAQKARNVQGMVDGTIGNAGDSSSDVLRSRQN